MVFPWCDHVCSGRWGPLWHRSQASAGSRHPKAFPAEVVATCFLTGAPPTHRALYTSRGELALIHVALDLTAQLCEAGRIVWSTHEGEYAARVNTSEHG